MLLAGFVNLENSCFFSSIFEGDFSNGLVFIPA